VLFHAFCSFSLCSVRFGRLQEVRKSGRWHLEERGNPMGEAINGWYGTGGDSLEVLFERKKGYFRDTANDAVMEKVDAEGNSIGFSILKVGAPKDH
jgi:hypothetical protein